MNGPKTKPDWTSFLKFYAEQNAGRSTRIGLFETVDGVTNDYWIESGLAFKGIDAEFVGDSTVVEIMLEGLTHVVRNVRSISPVYSVDGLEDGLNVTAADGSVTILRFEDR